MELNMSKTKRLLNPSVRLITVDQLRKLKLPKRAVDIFHRPGWGRMRVTITYSKNNPINLKTHYHWKHTEEPAHPQNGREEWSENDEHGREIYFRATRSCNTPDNCPHGFSPDGDRACTDIFEAWSEYNELGQCIHYRATDGEEYWNEFDEFGYPLHFRNNRGTEAWFDTNGKRYQTLV
jgi:hypothetical protein